MKNIDKRKSYFIVFDTETAYRHTPEGGEVNPFNTLVYDWGWAITDKMGNVYKTASYLIEEFYPLKCRNSYYYEKKAHIYNRNLMSGVTKIQYFDKVLAEFFADIKKYNVEKIYAHNAYFDYIAINSTFDYLHHRYRTADVFENIQVECTNRFAIKVVKTKKSYIDFCEQNGFLTKQGKPRTKAEVVYAYIQQNPNYQEEHTGLSDVLIEKDILAYCIRQHKKKGNIAVTKSYIK